MAWDFETEPEFEEQLAWMRSFVKEEIFPIETLDLTYDQVVALIKPLQDQVRARGLWAAHLPAELGGAGFGQVKLGLMHEILGQTPYGPLVFGNNAPDSGNAELIGVGLEMADRDNHRTKWLEPLLEGRLRSGFSMTEPNTAGSDPTLLSTRAVRDGDEWVIDGRKWYTTNGSVADFFIVMAVTNPDVHPYQGSSMIIVPVDTPGVTILRDVGSMDDPTVVYGKFGNHAEILYESPTTTSSATRVRASCWPRLALDPDGSTTACAGSDSRSAHSTTCASERSLATRTSRSSLRSRRCRTGSRTRWPRCTRRGS